MGEEGVREFVDLAARTDHGRRRMGRITSLESKATKGGRDELHYLSPLPPTMGYMQ